MTEVAFALLLISTLLMGWFQTRAAMTRALDERNVAEWITLYARATRSYLEDHAEKLLADGDKGVIDISAALRDGNYVARHWQSKRADGRSIRTLVRARCVDPKCTLRQAEGLVAVVDGAPFPEKTLGSIASRVEFGGGAVNDRGEVTGIAGNWRTVSADWNRVPQASRPVAMVFTLPERARVISSPAVSDLHYEPQSAARAQGRDAGVWQPLYSTDTMRITWQAKNVPRVRLEVIALDEEPRVYVNEVLEGKTAYVLTPVPDMLGKSIVARVTPFSDDVETLRPATTGPIRVSDYDGAPVSKISLKYKVWTASDRERLNGRDAICLLYLETRFPETNMYVGLEQIEIAAPNRYNVPREARYLRPFELQFRFDVRRDRGLGSIAESHGTPQSGSIVLKLHAPSDRWDKANVSDLEQQQRMRKLVYNCRHEDAFVVDLRAGINGGVKPYEVVAIKDGYLRQPFAANGPPTEHSFNDASEIYLD
ncbi:hypothetical protein SAMN05216551_101431 [Chitinasiproducens palmae]|uniref:Uncharacterized protein n=2 Tax=Chitinasiproducens palmae TaxID=1770053 RepID=A0A1H2PLK4_9BURK|nr:hypothetical protein SAMN05216551_101431 [Chitinasiproducens palmae]